MLLGLLPLTSCSDRSARLPETPGGWEDIDGYVARLVAAEDYAILIVDAGGPDAFLQFSASSDTVQLDFPLITDAQKAREASIRQFLEDRDLPAVINLGTDGSRFLDSDLPADTKLVSRVTREAFREIFGVGESARFTFSAQGLAPAP